MQDFADYYFMEKTIASDDHDSATSTHEDNKCMMIGKKIADRFGLIFNGWWEFTYTFTIPEHVPNARNTLMAHNEEELIEKLQQRFPEYLAYIMKKKFPDGYKPDPTIPKDVVPECEPIDLDNFK